jgi:hypothetical protein
MKTSAVFNVAKRISVGIYCSVPNIAIGLSSLIIP